MAMLSRAQVLQMFLSLYESPHYLQIGDGRGETFNNVSADVKVAVDPLFRGNATDGIENGQILKYFPISSDEYFSKLAQENNLFDVIFIDGLHTFEQVFRDLLNSIARLKPNGIIIIDDVIPNSYVASLPDITIVAKLWQDLGMRDRSWMGDVYKLVFLLQSSFQQWSYATVQQNHGQLVLWRQSRHASSLGKRKIEQISRLEYADVILCKEAFNIKPCADILAMVQKAIGGKESALKPIARRGLATFPTASAEQEYAKAASWADAFGLHNGCKTITEATEFTRTEFVCENKESFTPNCVRTLSEYKQRGVVSVPQIKLYAFDDVSLLPHGALLSNGNLVSETLKPIPAPYLSQVDEYLKNIDNADFGEVYESKMDRPVLMIEQPGLFNYGHWLVEMFPKVWPLLEDIVSGNIGICIPAQYRNSKIINGTLSHIGVFDKSIDWVDIHRYPDILTKVRRALYISPLSMHPGYISPWSVDVVNRLASDIPAGFQNKIFVSRKDATVRHLTNEDEVYAALEPLGYVRVFVGGMSFAEQVKCFKGASEIVGVYGASLTNTIFCEPGTKVLHICPNNYIDHFYYDIASIKQHAYWHFNGITGENANFLYDDFKVDIGIFGNVLEKFLAI